MKIAIVNGSPRKGNTYAAINAFMAGAVGRHSCEVIEADKLNISPCKGCGACQCQKGCVAKDDTNATVDKLVEADMILFATPVYWWGMTAQLKLVIDKCYCKGLLLKGKKVGILVAGGSPTDNIQYALIRKQFECIAEYLDWEIQFFKAYYAMAKGDLASDAAAVTELKTLGEQL